MRTLIERVRDGVSNGIVDIGNPRNGARDAEIEKHISRAFTISAVHLSHASMTLRNAASCGSSRFARSNANVGSGRPSQTRGSQHGGGSRRFGAARRAPPCARTKVQFWRDSALYRCRRSAEMLW